jgi:nucleoside 2-deoxyribosyltransferase
MDLEKITAANEIYERDTRWIRGCEAVIAEVSTPSHGVGYEIAYALGIGKPVLCCHKEGVPVSKMILGNDSPGLAIRSYESENEVLMMIDEFLAGLG